MKLHRRILQHAALAAGAAVVATLLTGCETTGLSARESGRASYSQLVYQAARNQPGARAARPLRRPVRLAIAQVGEVAPPAHVLARLRDHPDVIATVISLPMPGETRPPYDRWTDRRNAEVELSASRIAELRTLARTMGADEVFVFGGTIDTRTSRNALAILDITLVGMAIFPSADVHAEGKAAGLLIEAESGMIRFQVEAEQEKTGMTPSGFTYEKMDSVRVSVRDALAARLTDELVRKLRGN